VNDEMRIKMRAAIEAAKFIREARLREHKVLLDASDGPEGIRIYTSEEEGVVDWSGTFPAVYVEIALNGANAKFGPFQLAAIHEKLAAQLRPLPQRPIHQHDPFEGFGEQDARLVPGGKETVSE
jgi:hypothetical protein